MPRENKELTPDERYRRLQRLLIKNAIRGLFDLLFMTDGLEEREILIRALELAIKTLDEL